MHTLSCGGGRAAAWTDSCARRVLVTACLARWWEARPRREAGMVSKAGARTKICLLSCAPCNDLCECLGKRCGDEEDAVAVVMVVMMAVAHAISRRCRCGFCAQGLAGGAAAPPPSSSQSGLPAESQVARHPPDLRLVRRKLKMWDFRWMARFSGGGCSARSRQKRGGRKMEKKRAKQRSRRIWGDKWPFSSN